MSPRGEHEEEFADFELVNDCAFDYRKKKTSAEEPAKNTTIPKKSIATQCTPIATDMDKVKEAITELQVKVLDVSAETATQFEKLQTAVEDFGEQRVAQDRRMRTLEYSYDDYETDLKKCTHSIGILKERLETLQSASGKDADLRETCKENTARSIKSSSRLDFMVGYHLPSIEQNIKAVQIAQSESGSVSVDLRRTISLLKCQLGDLTEMHVAEIQQIAESADLRSKDVQSGLAHFIKNVIPELEDKIHELAYTSAKACKDSVASIAAISKDVKALQMDQESYRKAMAVDIENLETVDSQLIDETFKSKSRLDDVEEAVKTLSSKGDAMTVELEKMSTLVTAIDEANHETKHRVSRAEHVIQHLVGKVLPLLESRLQEHQELVQISKETAALEKAKSAEREAMFFKRIEELEAKTSRCNIASMQNLQLQVRVSSLEKMLNEIAGEVNQVHLQEQKVQLHPSIASAFAQTEESTIDEINEEIDELIEEVIEEAIEEVKMERSENVAPPAPKAADNGSITIQCKTFLGEAFTVSAPPFVSIRYLKQLIFFKSGCSMHPTAQSLVYAGKVLQDGWKVGGGMFTSSFGESNENDCEEFGGLKEGSTVLIVV